MAHCRRFAEVLWPVRPRPKCVHPVLFRHGQLRWKESCYVRDAHGDVQLHAEARDELCRRVGFRDVAERSRGRVRH